MFPSQQRAELVFGSQPDNMLLADDLVVDYTFDPLISISIDFGRTQKQEIQTQLGAITKHTQEEMKRIEHREYERRRREEMSKLYASLRSLLPLKHNKGKLSKSDHMQEAINYTKQLQKKVQELRARREMLRNLYTSSGTKNTTSLSGRDHNLPNCVTLNMEKDGMEILIRSRSSLISSEFRLSNVIKELHGKELNVASCVSTKINGGFLHKIQAEFSETRLIDVSMLRQTLAEMINCTCLRT